MKLSFSTGRRHGIAYRVVSEMRSSPFALLASIGLAIIVLLCLAAPWVAPNEPTAMNAAERLVPPGSDHWFGTDQFGRDVLSRVIWGGRITLISGGMGVTLSATMGVMLGLIAVLSGRFVSGLIMRLMDIMLAFPGLFIALVVVAVIGAGSVQVTIAVGLSFVPHFARLVYGSALAAREQEYVMVANSLGASPIRIAMRHLLPNIGTDVLVLVSSVIGWVILTTAALNFLGFGVQLPNPEWGSDISAGRSWIGPAWWIAGFPGIMISLVILSTNYIGDQLTAVVDPQRTTTGRMPSQLDTGLLEA
jgi:peptide/nickel transport system permease protein